MGLASNKIFDDFFRNDVTAKKNNETYFNFFNRSAWPEIETVRNLIESSISRYPLAEVDDLARRFRSGDDIHFKSASFELFLHEALLRTGFKLFPHPLLPNGIQFKPDFLVKAPDGEEFYLEAVLVAERNELDKGGEIRKGAVFDTLSASPHHNFMIVIDDEGTPKTQPSGKKLLNEIHNWLNTLDPDEISAQIQKAGLDSIAPLNWSHEGWDLQIRPIPISPERRGHSSNLIGMSGIGGGMLDAWSPIKDAVKFKGGKYGQLDKPLVIAVNFDSSFLHRIDEMQALFGQEQIVFNPRSKKSEMKRAPNGVWIGKGGPQCKRVSAVWIFNDLHATSLASRRNTIYFNPWANISIPNSLKIFPHGIVEDEKMNWIEGLSFREVFQLDEDWPEKTNESGIK